MLEARRDPVTGLYCRSDGAVLMPPSGIKFRKFRWTFGSIDRYGYCVVKFRNKNHKVHQMACRAFNGLAPAGKPFVDHINRIKGDNRSSNLHWVDNKENQGNQVSVDKSIEKYGVRECEDPKAYNRAWCAARRAEMKAQGLTFRKGPSGKWGWYPKELA